MTTHELAKLLLNIPDKPVDIYVNDMKDKHVEVSTWYVVFKTVSEVQ